MDAAVAAQQALELPSCGWIRTGSAEYAAAIILGPVPEFLGGTSDGCWARKVRYC